MSKIYVRLLTVAATLIAVTGAFFSIAGLTKLFAGAPRSVAVMAASLEFSKLVVTGFVYRYWGHINKLMRSYLIFAIITLVLITSLGIFGYLSNAYQVASLSMRTQVIKMKSLTDESERIDSQIKEFRRFIDEIPTNRITKKFEFQREYAPRIRKLQKRSDEIAAEVASMKVAMVSTHTELGPVIYLADAFDVEADTIVKFFIFIFVLVFDPLAVCLVFCLNLAIRLREKYRNNEQRISSHALSTPVDHRRSGKKAA